MKKIILLLALFSVIIVATSCGKAEEAAIRGYFHAMQINDKDTMASMAVEPKDIDWKSYKITSISEPEEIDLELPKLEKKLEELNKAKREQVNVALDKRDELDEAQFELEETRRRTKKRELEKKVEELQTQLTEEEQKVKEIQAEINNLNQQIKIEKNAIGMSASVTENLGLYTGKTLLIKVVINITLNNDENKDYVFLLRKDVLTLQDRSLPSRYIITKIETVEDFEKMEQMEQQKEEEMQTPTEEVTEDQPVTEEETTEQQ